MTMRRGAAALAVVGLAGCPAPHEGRCAPCAGRDCAPTLTIGLGTDRYAPLDEGEAFPLIHGPQGGYHLDVGLRATHLDASSLVVGHVEGTVDGVVLAEVDPWLDFRCVGGQLESWGTRLIYDATPADLDGKSTRIAVEVTDASGTEVTAEGTYLIRDAP